MYSSQTYNGIKCSRVLCMRVNYTAFYLVITLQKYLDLACILFDKSYTFGEIRPVTRDHHSCCQGQIFTDE